MEQLLLAQNEITINIGQVLSNYKRDSISRKTKSYLEKKIAYVKAAHQEFIANDGKIQAISPPIGNSHPYRSSRTTTQDECTWLLTDMRQRLNAGPPSTPTGTSGSIWGPEFQPESNDDEDHSETHQTEPEPNVNKGNQQSGKPPPLKPLGSSSHSSNDHIKTTAEPLNPVFKRQDFYMRQLHQEIYTIEGRLDKGDYPKEYLHLKVNQLQGQMTDIYQLHATIMVETDEEDKTTSYFVQDYYGTIKNRVENIIIRLQQCQELVERITSKPHVEQKVKLPQIEIPSFYGDYDKWTSFKDLFIEVIHNNATLSNTMKMTYLKSKLQKGAAQLIAHLAATGENYDMAWETVKARYDNRRLLSSNYFNSLLSMTTLQQATGPAIRSMHDTLKEVLHNIQQLELESSFEAFVVFLVTKKLDPESIGLFETNLQQPKEIPTLNVLFGFLERRFQSLEAMGKNKPVTTPRQPVAQPLKRVNVATASVRCVAPNCNGNHSLEICPRFKNMTTLERAKLVNHLQLCVRCLEGHDRFKCSATECCVVCNGRHNTLLHCNNSASKTEQVSKTFVVQQTAAVLLPTAVVQASTANGQLVTLRALIDPGSQATLISSRAVNLFNFKKKKINIKISGIGGQVAGVCKHAINTTLSPNFPGRFTLAIEALVFDNLDHQLPQAKVDDSKWTHLDRLKLADPRFNYPQPIDLIIGVDYYTSIAIDNIIKSGPNDLMAQETELGWILMGNMGQRSEEKLTMVSTKAIENQLKLLVENDDIQDERVRTEEEQKAEEHFSSTVQRNDDGRYTVRIPFKENPPQLGESKKTATARLLQLERRFSKDAPFKQLYQNFMQEYLDLGHMELLPKVQDHLNYNSYYIPHHGIMKQDSTTTKLRVVFDASSKTTNGSSLNEKMMIGPKLQQDLADIILRWRKHQYVLTADIEKMYRQVWMHEQDRNYQLILWRSEPTNPIETYRLKTVTYGTTAASFLAVRALRKLAEDERRSFPIASEIILSDYYVDDLLTGSDSIDHGSTMIQQLMRLSEKGGLKLRKWSSNSKELLTQIPTELQATGNVLLKLSDCIKTLGIHYNPNKDNFEFHVDNLEMSEGTATKRSLLADSSKLFDPVGWLAPITIAAKILMQDTWISGIEWDEPLPEAIGKKWLVYKNEMPAVKDIKIPRWLSTTRGTRKELHGFADASELAYAAVVYCRTTNAAGQVTTNLVMAKTRVAPIKTKLSVPRLELNAARLLAKLLRHVQLAMQLSECQTHAWTDSTITLSWVKGEPRRFKTFVANRISCIRQNLPTTTWHHVRSSENPADLASRGKSPGELVHCKLWWHGPAFLQHNSTQWEISRHIEQNSEMDPQVYLPEEYEEKVTLTASTNLTNVWLELFQRISSYDKVKRVVANCATFINRVARKIPAIKAITPETIIFHISQEEDFYQELRCLRNTQRLPNNSKLSSLNPFLDDNGVLRMRGRLQNANILTTSKNPIILGKNNPITRKLIERAHKLMLHGGVQLTLSHLRDRYWILDGRRAVRFVIKKCIICFRHQQQNASQLMGDLPGARVRPGRPFAKTGIDYAGPIQLRTTKGRGHKSYKGYIALFVCMVTKAVHIEIVSSLTTVAFIAAYQRFTSRRGLCTDLYSDNGTYFVGADGEMKKNLRIALTTLPVEIANEISVSETTWHFIPPFAPHFGGIWEAGIKSVKSHLKRVIGATTLTFEELSTVTAQIEACLNSRPLTPLTNDPSDLQALTPGHFLIGEALKSQPAAVGENIPLTARWHLVQRMIQDFWKRWSAEYLHQLQQRSKWKTPQPNLSINDLVLLRDDQFPATHWKLGRIIETQAGPDGLVRVATVKCKDNVYKRPITKLCKLPIEAETTDIPEYEAPNNEAPHIRKQPPRRAKDGLRASNLALALLSVCTILGLAHGITNIRPFDHPFGIHFEEMGTLEAVAMKWKLVIFYNLTDYWKEVENCKQAIVQLEESCRDLSGFNYNTTLQHLQWRLNNLIAKNKLLEDSNKERKRSKRGLGDTLGIALGDIFGILSQRDAEEYESQFEMINANENHLMKLMQNQTSIIDNTVQLIKHNSNLTMMSINNLLQEQRRLREELIVLREYRSYEERVRSVLMNIIELTLIMQNLEDTQHSLLDIVYSAHHEILHPTILTPDQLEEQLSLIRQHVPTAVNVPGHQLSDLIHVYQSLTVRSRMTNQSVIIEIIIPLAFATEYTLLSVTAVPDILHDNTQSSIVTSTEYLAMDSHREHFAFLSTEQLSRCQTVSSSNFLCETSPVFNALTNNGRCEIAILQRKSGLERFCSFQTSNSTNRWIPMKAPNQWIYAVPNETTVDILCGSQSSPHTLQGSGIISIDAGCILRDRDLYIVAVGAASNSISKAFQKSTSGITTSKQLKNFGSHIKTKVRDDAASDLISVLDTKKLEEEIASLRENEHLIQRNVFFTNQNQHHVHHYIMTHVLFWSAVIVGTIWIIAYLRRRRPLPPLQHQSMDATT